MNLDHFKTVLWLRWRLRTNQFKRGGTLNAVLFYIIVAMAAATIVTVFFVGATVGVVVLPRQSPAIQMYVWDGLIAAVLFSWSIGLLSALQRTESLSLDRFLHLPVSLTGVFIINYLSSIVTFTLLCFVPACIGMLLGQAFSQPLLLLAIPLLAAFVFALTALTYQFQGWLALLMSNPRRRRTIIVLVTGSFVLFAQTPQLLNFYQPWKSITAVSERHQQQLQELSQEFIAKKITLDEYNRRQQELNTEYARNVREESDRRKDQMERYGYIANLAIPPAWLALGVYGLASGEVLPALLCTVSFTLVGVWSLRRAYRTTLRYYTGAATAHGSAPVSNVVSAPMGPRRLLLVERQLPWLSEHASCVALASFRGLSRAPEVKMMMIGPLMMLIMMGVLFGPRVGEVPRIAAPFAVFTAAAMTVVITVQLIANQFGYDRTGFRAYVLGPVPRREILLGKNLALAPFTLGMALVAMVIAGIIVLLRIDHYLAILAQLLALYLLCCIFMNLLSIFAPIPIASGSMRPAQVRWGPVLLQMAFMFVYPVILAPVLLPFGVEILLEEFGMIPGIPVALVLSLVVLGLVLLLYRRVITGQGGMLHAREQKILEVVTSREE